MAVLKSERLNLILLGLVAGMLFAWACAPGDMVPPANAQTSSSCARWEVLFVGKQVDVDEESPSGGDGPWTLGHPEPFVEEIDVFGATVQMPQTAAEGAFALPDGWEPFALDSDSGIFAVRRCAA